MLVLSKAVLVIVIDVSMTLRAGLRDTIEFHRHSGQHRDDPIAHPFHRGVVLNVDPVGPQQHVLDGGTLQADIKARFDYEYDDEQEQPWYTPITPITSHLSFAVSH